MNSLLEAFEKGFASSGVEQGSTSSFFVALLAATLLGVVLSKIYSLYFRDYESQDGNIPRSFPLMSPAVTTVFWLIQYSLPLSLGLLGALSFVRFRAPVKKAEDIAFILLVIAGSLSCAVNKFHLAFILCSIVPVYGVVRNLISSKRKTSLVVSLRTEVEHKEDEVARKIQESIEVRKKPVVLSTNFSDGVYSYIIRVNKVDTKNTSLEKIVKAFDNKVRVDTYFPDKIIYEQL